MPPFMKFVLTFVGALVLILFIALLFDEKASPIFRQEVDSSLSDKSGRRPSSPFSEQEAKGLDLVRVRENPPKGLPVPGKPHLVQSPYSPNKGYIDITGLEPGTTVLCHWSNKPFILPDSGGVTIEWLPPSAEPNPEPDTQPEPGHERSESTLLTLRYRLPPNTLDGAVSARAFLEQNGVQFEEGATAFYISSSAELVVRNTEGQLQTVEALVSELSKADVPQP